jgi:hypothetical protein
MPDTKLSFISLSKTEDARLSRLGADTFEVKYKAEQQERSPVLVPDPDHDPEDGPELEEWTTLDFIVVIQFQRIYGDHKKVNILRASIEVDADGSKCGTDFFSAMAKLGSNCRRISEALTEADPEHSIMLPW